MKVLLQSQERTLLSLSTEELTGIRNALNEVCNDGRFSEGELQTRLGVTREFLDALRSQMPADAGSPDTAIERADVWAQNSSVHMVCTSASGDPVELSPSEARGFAQRLQLAIAEAE